MSQTTTEKRTPPTEAEAPRPSKSRRLKWKLGAIVVVTAAGLGIYAATTNGSSEEDGGLSTVPAATATIERRDLVDSDTFAGTLGYDDGRPLVGGIQGVATSLPEEGGVLRRGDVIYRVNTEPVVLFYGSQPQWRPLSEGIEGQDVNQLERNLVALGFADFEPDHDFGSLTTDAVLAWQEEVGLAEDGVVDLGEIVFEPGSRRVASVVAEIGGSLGPGPVLTTTSTRRVVTVALEASRQDVVDEGQRVDIELGDGSTVRGRVIEVGRVAEQSDPESEPTVEVTIEPSRSKATGRLDQAPVDVDIATDVTSDVLAAPVAALLALAEGGYGLELWDGHERTLVAVETGAYASGWVEVSGSGLEEGLEVVVPE